MDAEEEEEVRNRAPYLAFQSMTEKVKIGEIKLGALGGRTSQT